MVGKTAPTMTTAATVTPSAPVVGSRADHERHGNAERARPGRSLARPVTFWLVGPVAPGSPCPARSSSRVAPITVPLDAELSTATTGTQTFTPTLAGDYYWIAQYRRRRGERRGDARAVPTRLELVQVGKATPTVTTAATVAPVDPVVNQPVTTTDTATLVGAVNPDGTGAVTFWLVGPATGTPPACPSTDAAVIDADHRTDRRTGPRRRVR